MRRRVRAWDRGLVPDHRPFRGMAGRAIPVRGGALGGWLPDWPGPPQGPGRLRNRDERMHMVMVIVAGLLLLAVFALFGRLWGHDAASVALAARWFIPVWVGVALVNLWVGVTRAGYTLAQELPILLVVVAVPALVAGVLAWQMKG